jgi:hypothetical protein
VGDPRSPSHAGPVSADEATWARTTDTTEAWVGSSGGTLDEQIFALVTAPIAAAAGAIYGSATAVPKAQADQIGRLAAAHYSNQIFWDGAGRMAASLQAVGFDSMRFERIGEWTGLDQDTPANRRALAQRGNDSELRVAITHWRLNGEGRTDPNLRLEIDADVRLVGLSSGEPKYQLDWKYRGAWRPWSRWSVERGTALRQEFQWASMQLFDRITDDLFLTVSMPVVRLSKNPFNDFNVCGLRPDASLVNPIGNNIATVRSRRPILSWERFPRKDDLGPDSPVTALEATDISYDLRIWKREPGGSIQDVVDVTDLKEPRFQVPQPLEWDGIYGWSVRARFHTHGGVRATAWMLVHSQADMLRIVGPPPFACPGLPEGRTVTRRVFEFTPNRP